MKKEEWQKGLDAWINVKKQAALDVEQATLYIEAIKSKIASLKDSDTEVK